METKKPNITSEELFDLASSEIDREVTFPQEMMEGLRVKYENQKDEYAEGNKEVKQLLEAGVVQDAARITKAEEFKKSISSDIDPSVLGNNLEAKFGQPFMLDIANIINGNNEVVYDGNMPGYEFEDGFNRKPVVIDADNPFDGDNLSDNFSNPSVDLEKESDDDSPFP